MTRNQFDSMIGCASIPMLHNGVVSGDVAASIWRQLQVTHLAAIEYQVRPRLLLPMLMRIGDLPTRYRKHFWGHAGGRVPS